MLSLFCLRLASGLAAATLLLPRSGINPRFFRTHSLAILGLTAASIALGWRNTGIALTAALILSLGLSFLSCLIWTLEGAPGAAWVGPAVAISLAASLVVGNLNAGPKEFIVRTVDDLTSAALLGGGTTAMLVGHSYLISPTMSIKPLLRTLKGLFFCLLGRILVSAIGLSFWTSSHSLGAWNEITLLLPVRWGIGFIAPAILGTMAWQTARIRSTQSATGILYVVVIFCFLGELVSQMLFDTTGYIL